MVQRQPLVIVGGKPQQLQVGDTIAGVASTSPIKVISGQAVISTSGPFQKFTITDITIIAGMKIIVQPVMSDIMTAGIICHAVVIRQSAGSFDVVLSLFGIDGKPAPTQLSKRIITLNYHGA